MHTFSVHMPSIPTNALTSYVASKRRKHQKTTRKCSVSVWTLPMLQLACYLSKAATQVTWAVQIQKSWILPINRGFRSKALRNPLNSSQIFSNLPRAQLESTALKSCYMPLVSRWKFESWICKAALATLKSWSDKARFKVNLLISVSFHKSASSAWLFNFVANKYVLKSKSG